MKKLTRQAQIFIFILGMVILFVLGYFVITMNSSSETTESKDTNQVTVVFENQKILSTYIDPVSQANSSTDFVSQDITIEKGTKIKDYTLSQNQTFSKYIQMLGPDGEEILSSKSKQVVTHYAYTLLLTGDMVEVTDANTKAKTYQIVNARITYSRIPFVLLSNENSVCLANKNKTKEKIVNLTDFTNALKDINKRDTMISWS